MGQYLITPRDNGYVLQVDGCGVAVVGGACLTGSARSTRWTARPFTRNLTLYQTCSADASTPPHCTLALQRCVETVAVCGARFTVTGQAAAFDLVRFNGLASDTLAAAGVV